MHFLTGIENFQNRRLSVLESHFIKKSPHSPGHNSTVSKSAVLKRPPITTHVLDVSAGKPAVGVPVTLEKLQEETETWFHVGKSFTNEDGRAGPLMSLERPLESGVYRLSFDIKKYNESRNVVGFFPVATITFLVAEWQTREHFHVPLLLSPFSFSTYRGS